MARRGAGSSVEAALLERVALAIRAHRSGFPARLLAFWAAVCLALALHACKRKEPPPPRPRAAAPGQPSSAPRRLTAVTEVFGQSWREAVSELPDCTPLLPKEAERTSCSAARAAAEAINAAFARGAAHEQIMPLAATAALTGQRAAQVLRSKGIARLFERRPNASPSATSAPASTQPIRPKPPAGLPSALVRSQGSADLDAITSYSRIATVGLHHLAMYLEFGAPALRRSTLREVERLARDEPHWAGLRALVYEAHLVEADPDLKRELARLLEQLG